MAFISSSQPLLRSCYYVRIFLSLRILCDSSRYILLQSAAEVPSTLLAPPYQTFNIYEVNC